MPDKNVQLPDGRVVAFPDSMADADISAVIKKQLGTSNKPPEAPGVAPTKDMLSDMFSATHNLAPMGSEKEAAGNLPMIAATAASGAAGPEAGVFVRMLLGMFGAGASSPVKQKLQGKEVTAGETAVDTATGAIPGAIEGLGNVKSALKNALFHSNGELNAFGKAVTHPTELPEMAMRKVLDVPAEPVKAVPITKSPNFNPAAYRAGRTSINPPETPAAPSSPFGNATPTNVPVGNAKLSDLAGKTPVSQPQVQMVNKFEPPAQGKIVSPESAPPDIKVTYQSVPQAELLRKVKSGDLFAIREWQRRGLDLPPNVKFLAESAGTKPWRNANQ